MFVGHYLYFNKKIDEKLDYQPILNTGIIFPDSQPSDPAFCATEKQ
jgi:hypothetical protein